MINLVDFPERLAQRRHDQGLTQAALAERVGIHVSQVRRYEQGSAQPTLDVIRRLTLALNTNADQLIFDADQNSAENGEWHLRLEAINHLDPDEQQAIRTVIDGILLRQDSVLGIGASRNGGTPNAVVESDRWRAKRVLGLYASEWGARFLIRGGDGLSGQVIPPVWSSTRSRQC